MKKFIANTKRLIALLMGTAMFFACSLGDDPDQAVNPVIFPGLGMCSVDGSTLQDYDSRTA